MLLDFCKMPFPDLLRPWLWRYTTPIWSDALICSRPCSALQIMFTQSGNDAFASPILFLHICVVTHAENLKEKFRHVCMFCITIEANTGRVTCTWPNPSLSPRSCQTLWIIFSAARSSSMSFCVRKPFLSHIKVLVSYFPAPSIISILPLPCLLTTSAHACRIQTRFCSHD